MAKLDNLRDALKETFGESNIVQIDEFPNVDRFQVVIKLKPFKLLGKEHYSRLDVYTQTQLVLLLCRSLELPRDLRLSFKIQSDLTVSDMIFGKKSIAAYHEGAELESFAQKWHIVSGLK